MHYAYAYEAMQGVVNRYRLAGFPPDVLITVPKDACRTLAFSTRRPDGRTRSGTHRPRARSVQGPTGANPQSAQLDSCQLGVAAREQG